MGLDNGIMVRGNSATSRYDNYFKNKEILVGDYEICYWRKCWNIRAALKWRLKLEEGGDTELTVNDLREVVEVLSSFNEENWGDWGSSIWTFEEQQPHLCAQTAALMELIEIMEQDPEISVYFYDSY